MDVAQPTKAPVSLYYRDPIKCLESLMRNPLHADVMEFEAYRLYQNAEKLVRVYAEWLSGESVWQMQVCYLFTCF